MDKLNQTFLNKRVSVISETPFDKEAKFVGICTFIGLNEYLNKLQVTVNRTPLFVKDFSKVKLVDDIK